MTSAACFSSGSYAQPAGFLPDSGLGVMECPGCPGCPDNPVRQPGEPGCYSLGCPGCPGCPDGNTTPVNPGDPGCL
jgi:hypothetical protein